MLPSLATTAVSETLQVGGICAAPGASGAAAGCPLTAGTGGRIGGLRSIATSRTSTSGNRLDVSSLTVVSTAPALQTTGSLTQTDFGKTEPPGRPRNSLRASA
jgi:hypothetical protein